jgi:tetratricopeptide (TPR) repeat protein
MRPPQLGEEQIVCGPDWPDDISPDGRVRSLHTPVGAYDLGEVLAKIPAAQQPDVVACLVDASRRNLPRNVRAFAGPMVLMIADTHHLQSPVMTMIRYAASEAYDQLVLMYDRHHAEFFRAAGFKNLHWFPGLTFPHGDAAVRAAWSAAPRTPHLAFVGQAAARHPRRARLLAALRHAGLPVGQEMVGQTAALGVYGRSLLGFNASLNGDLNLRIFEIMASGAFLVTDRLAASGGLPTMFTERRDLDLYGSEQELVACAARRLKDRQETHALGQAAAARFLEIMGEARRREMFAALALEGRSPEPFPLFDAGATHVDFGGLPGLLANVMVYEGLQELHRTQETVRVEVSPTLATCFPMLCATLPRVQLVTAPAAEPVDLLVTAAADADAATTGAARVWCAEVNAAVRPELDARMTLAGYKSTSSELAFYCRDTQAATSPNQAAQLAAEGRARYQRGDQAGALELGRAALQQDGRCFGALTLLAEISLQAGGAAVAEKLFHQATLVAPGDAGAHAGLAAAKLAQNRLTEAERDVTIARKLDPEALPVMLTLARLREKQHRPEEAVAALRDAVRIHPETEPMTQLGLLLRRQGQVFEGLEWQRRARGLTDEILPVDAASGPIRVAFLAQHPQGWSSLESVWQSMAGDPAFAPTIIAAPYQHPYPPEGGPEAIYGFLTRQGFPFKRWDEFPLVPGFADVVFVQNPYDVTRPAPLRTPELLKLVPRLAYVPYGLEIGGGDTNAQNQFNLPLQQHAWAVFARSPRHRAMFARHCAAGDAHVAVTGHPRLDLLRDLDRHPVPAEFSRFAKGRKIVVWNPQFDVRPDGTGYSTFLTWQEFLLKEFARRQDLAFIIRPHPLFFGALESRRIWVRAQVDAFLKRVARAGNILIDRDASYLPAFAASAAMISDASTFLLEYTGTGKPLLYLHNPKGPSLNDDGEYIRTHGYTAERSEDITRFLDQVAAGEDPRGAARMAAYPQVMHRPDLGVAAAIKQELLARFAAEARHVTPAAAVA